MFICGNFLNKDFNFVLFYYFLLLVTRKGKTKHGNLLVNISMNFQNKDFMLVFYFLLLVTVWVSEERLSMPIYMSTDVQLYFVTV